MPADQLGEYINLVASLKERHSEISGHEEMSVKAYEKFKKCRTEASQNSLKKSKTLPLSVHSLFQEGLEPEEQSFLQRVKNFTPKKSFLELQKIALNLEPENDVFLSAVERMRREQEEKGREAERREELREKKASRWKEILDRKEIEEFERYRDQKNRERTPITFVEGVNVEIQQPRPKKARNDFRNPSQYISAEKNPNERTEFDDLPRIKTSEVDTMIRDENPVRRGGERRVWDKSKKNFVWQRDREDRPSKEEAGKKAYQKWKKKFKLSIPKAGEAEDNEQVQRAKDNWKSRRMARHGWKEAKPKGEPRGRNLKNNKTKAIEKKFKKRLISKAAKGKARGKPAFKKR